MNETCTVLLPSVGIDDPHLCTDSHAVLLLRRLLFQRLVAYDGSALRGVLAERWEIEDEGRTWVFHLRREARLPGGRALEAGDVVYSLKRAASPAVPGQLFTVTWQEYIGRAEIEAADPSTVVLRSPEPIADLGELLSELAILPAGWHSCADGAGAFELADHDEGRVALRRRDGTGGSGAWPGRIEFRGEPDPIRRVAEVRSGRADLALDPPLEELESLDTAAETAVCGWDTPLSVIFFINCASPPFSDPRLRRALNLAVDREGLIRDVLLGHGKPLNGPFSDRHFGRDPRVAPYPHDPEQARSLLLQAGLAAGFPLEIHAPTTIPEQGPALAAFLSRAYREIGFETRVVLHRDRSEYARKIAARELGGLSCFDSSPLSTYKVLHEKLDSRSAGTWWQGFHDEGVNELLSRAAATVATAARRQVYWQIYRILHDEAPWVFLYQPRRFWVRRRDSGPCFAIDDLGFPAA